MLQQTASRTGLEPKITRPNVLTKIWPNCVAFVYVGLSEEFILQQYYIIPNLYYTSIISYGVGCVFAGLMPIVFFSSP